MTERWQSICGLVDVVTSRHLARLDLGGPAALAIHDQDSATIRDHIASIGVDLNDRDQLLSFIAGAATVVTVANCEYRNERATDIAVKVVDNFAEQLITYVLDLLPAEAGA